MKLEVAKTNGWGHRRRAKCGISDDPFRNGVLVDSVCSRDSPHTARLMMATITRGLVARTVGLIEKGAASPVLFLELSGDFPADALDSAAFSSPPDSAE